MPVSSPELSALAAGHDIVSLGMIADDARRQRHGAQTTFVRVAMTSAELHAPIVRPKSTGEVRIEGAPANARAAVERTAEVASAVRAFGDVPLSGFSLADLEALAGGAAMLRPFLEELRSA